MQNNYFFIQNYFKRVIILKCNERINNNHIYLNQSNDFQKDL